MLHIRGSYEQAANLIEQELSLADTSIPATDPLMLALRIRLIHHYMFYKPVLPLIEQMNVLLRSSKESNNPEEYGEILFMLGGNLGTLRGRSHVSRRFLFDAIRHSIKFNDEYLLCRCLRKYGDFLRERKHLNKADWFLHKGFEIAKKHQLRHIIYYLGSFGDLERQRRNLTQSERLFDEAIDRARASFVPGWLGNLFLGKAELAVDSGKYDQACVFLEQSEAHYQRTRPRHAWGEIQVNLCRSRIGLLSKNSEWKSFALAAQELSSDFGYQRDQEFAAKLLRTAKPLSTVLMFL
jgi:tetratricopeptide (TPR) repeat protein